MDLECFIQVAAEWLFDVNVLASLHRVDSDL